tara:strand:- start:437877 stop:439949 length:2073 start_codon:yes stop_codon:yes gene_type:complete
LKFKAVARIDLPPARKYRLMNRSKSARIFLYAGAGFLLFVVIFAVVLLTFNWNHLKPTINQRVSEATGRTFEIRGDLDLNWQRVSDETGWHAWIPWPRLSAQDVVMSNPDWTKTGPQMLNLKQVAASINPWPLLAKSVSLRDLNIEGLTLNLERTATNQNNWTFKRDEEDETPSPWSFDIGKLQAKEVALRYLDPANKLDLTAKLDTLDQVDAKNFGTQFKLSGSYNKAPISGGGKAGSVLSLRDKEAVFPVSADLQIGKNRIAIDGTVTQPTAVTAIDMHLLLAGESMANLYPLTGVLLPDTPPYETKGRLVGKMGGADGGEWTYEKFTGKVGSSDLSGTLHYVFKKPRPLLHGELVSNQLRLDDLGPLVKADSNTQKKNRGAVAVQPTDKALPVENFTTSKWDALDADVKFTGHKIIRDAALPIQDMVAELHMKDKVLSLTPLDFGVAGGRLRSNIKLDGQADKIKAEIKTSARGLKIRQLFPTLESMQASFGEVNADASLSGSGNSISAMLASSNGELKAAVSEGSISKFILEAAGLNIPNAIFSKLFGDKQVQLNCLASDFVVTDGLMKTRYFVLDTEDAVINVSGDINLATEAMDLDVVPKTKGLRIISLRSPLYAKGTFKDPDIGLQKGPLLAKAGGAAALAVINPLAALIPLIKTGGTPDIDCAKLLADAKAKPNAPPPGQQK